MTAAPESLEGLSMKITQEIRVRASLETTFAALLEQLGPGSETMDGTPRAMILEAWPGGRWYRDLGEKDGHFWATVQAIKRPALLELCGPMFMSLPVMNNMQYRLTEEGGETVIRFCHQGFGPIDEGLRGALTGGWGYVHERVVKRAEK